MSNEFVKACRLYNKGLCCQKWMLKLIHDHVPNYCLSSFVKEIPDQTKEKMAGAGTAQDHIGLDIKAALFLQ
jgi:hypothetical protein